MPREARVFIVDNQPVFRLGLVQAMKREADLTICGQASSATEAIEKIGKLEPDWVILDIGLEDSSGLDLLKELRTQNTTLPCLVLSAHPEFHYAHRAIQAGAVGYLTKQESVAEILTAIRAILKGGVHLKASVATRFFDRSGEGSSTAIESTIDSLTQREFEVFGLIGQEYSVSEIAKRLHVSVKTIETHRAHIKEKLHLVSANELLIFAVEWTKGEES